MTSTASSASADAVVPEPRLSLPALAPDQFRAMLAFGRSVELDRALSELIKVRVSQINGCSYCLDLHVHAARAAGVTQQRLDMLAAWREAPFYSARERAALALAESVTLIAEQGPIPDAVFDAAREHFDDAELAQVLFSIAAINSWNRLMVAAKTLPVAR